MDAVKSRRAEYAEQTRAALMAAAVRTFAERGFAATSIIEVAKAARVTKGAVYHHFTDKRSLLEAVVAQCNETAQQRVFAAIARHPDDQWAAAVAGLEETLEVCADPVIGRLIYLEGPVGMGWTRWREAELLYTHRNVNQLLLTGISTGIFDRDMPAEAMTLVIAGMVTQAGIALAEAPARRKKQLRAELQSAIKRVLFGLRRGRAGSIAADD